MASLIPGSTIKGRVARRVEFESPTAAGRQRLYLGKVTLNEGLEFVDRLEQVLVNLRLGQSPGSVLCEWINGLSSQMNQKLVAKGLVKATGSAITLGDFLNQYFDALRVKPETRLMYNHTRRNLIAHFGDARPMQSIDSGDGEKFKLFLTNLLREDGKPRLSKATIGKRVGMARQFFEAARRLKYTSENPFAFVKGGCQRNPGKLVFVKREWIDALLQACVDESWRLMVLLARYGGIRMPSEVRNLKWEHVDFSNSQILIHSPKTEHHAGHESRLIPMFDELRKPLLDAFTNALPGTEYVISNPVWRNSRNLRTQLNRLIGRAGLPLWVKPWQNMRSTRETELVKSIGIKAACKIIGNSESVAMAHYVQLEPGYIASAIYAEREARITAHKAPETSGIDRTCQVSAILGKDQTLGKTKQIPLNAPVCRDVESRSLGAIGFEPMKA